MTMLHFKDFYKNSISFLNLIFLIIFTLYITKRSFSFDTIWWYDLSLYYDQNKTIFQDFFCHVFNFSIIPFYYFSKIFGFKFSVYLFTFILGHFYAYFLSLILKNYFAIKGFIEIYFINFFFFIPFSIGVFYLDQLAILFILLTLFFFIKNKKINLIFSSFFLSISFFIKFYYIIPYIVFCILLFIISFLTKNFILIKKLLLQFLFCTLFFFVGFLFFFKSNFSNIDIFYDYLFNNNKEFSAGRFNNFFINILFLKYDLFSIIKNLNVGSMFLYPFIVSYYFAVFLIVVKVFKLKKNYTLINEIQLMILLFFTVSAPLYFIIAGRDWNHKLYFMVPLFLIIVDKLLLLFKKKNLDLSNCKKLVFFFIILYSLIPLNERYNLKSLFFSNNTTFVEEIILNNRYADFIFYTRSSYLADNNVKNLNFQKDQVANFLIKNNFNNLPIFSLDEPSKLIKLHLNSQTCDIGCYNFMGHNPPYADKSLKKYINLFDNQIKKSAIIIICKVNDDYFCLNSTDIKNKSVPTSKNNHSIKQILLLMKQNNFILIHNTKNFFIYKN